MDSLQSRRHFLSHCAKFGGACWAMMVLKPQLGAHDGQENKQDPEKKPVDLQELSCCGLPCAKFCELYHATLENSVEKKKLVYEKWEMKKTFGIEFDPDKIFCYGCRPVDKPLKIGMDTCAVRICALKNGIESCVQCRNLMVCDQEYWKKWPQAYDFAKKTQTRYSTQAGAILVDGKKG